MHRLPQPGHTGATALVYQAVTGLQTCFLGQTVDLRRLPHGEGVPALVIAAVEASRGPTWTSDDEQTQYEKQGSIHTGNFTIRQPVSTAQ